jgi:hypothetical protein
MFPEFKQYETQKTTMKGNNKNSDSIETEELKKGKEALEDILGVKSKDKWTAFLNRSPVNDCLENGSFEDSEKFLKAAKEHGEVTKDRFGNTVMYYDGSGNVTTHNVSRGDWNSTDYTARICSSSISIYLD